MSGDIGSIYKQPKDGKGGLDQPVCCRLARVIQSHTPDPSPWLRGSSGS